MTNSAAVKMRIDQDSHKIGLEGIVMDSKMMRPALIRFDRT